MTTEKIILYEHHMYDKFDMFGQGTKYPILTRQYQKPCDVFDIIKDIINMYNFLPTPDISELKDWLLSSRKFETKDNFHLITIPPETDAIDYEKVFYLVYSKPSDVDDKSSQLSLFE